MLRQVILVSESAILLVLIMFIGSLALWVGVPLGCLWLGSRVQAETGSLGFALFSMMVGMLLTTVALVTFLGRLDRRLTEVQEQRGHHPGGGSTVRGRRQPSTALEQVLVLSSVVAVTGFSIWFFGFSGSPPLPGLELSY